MLKDRVLEAKLKILEETLMRKNEENMQKTQEAIVAINLKNLQANQEKLIEQLELFKKDVKKLTLDVIKDTVKNEKTL